MSTGAPSLNSSFAPSATPSIPAVRSVQIGMHALGSSAGGVDRYVTGLLGGLKAIGCEVKVGVFGEKKPEWPDEVRSLGSQRDKLRARWGRVRSYVREELAHSPDLVASHFALYGVPVRRAALGLPHVVHFHGPWALESAAEGQGRIAVWLKRQLELRVYRSANLCIADSKAFAELLAKNYRVAPEKIRAVPCGVDTAHFAPRAGRMAARQALGWAADGPIIFCVRRLARRMGLDVLLEAFALVRRQHPTARLMIGGRGAIAVELAAQATALGLDSAVTWLGFVSEANLPLCYEAADFSIVPSQSLEGFGLIAVESLACGTPVLVTPIGGLPEVVAALDPQLVLADAGVAALADGMSMALTSPEKLPTAGACRTYAETHFQWSRVARQVQAAYQEAVNGFSEIPR